MTINRSAKSPDGSSARRHVGAVPVSLGLQGVPAGGLDRAAGRIGVDLDSRLQERRADHQRERLPLAGQGEQMQYAVLQQIVGLHVFVPERQVIATRDGHAVEPLD